jgi:hypothetical protein
MVVARVSTALPSQKGQLAGRAPPSAEGESGIVMVSSAARVERDEFDVYQSRKAIVSIRSEEILLGHRDFVALLAPPVNGEPGYKRREHVRRSAVFAASTRHHARRDHFVY